MYDVYSLFCQDLNNAPIGEYKYLVGMYPTAAGKIASHGPYSTVADIYKIEGLTGMHISNVFFFSYMFYEIFSNALL